MQNYIFFWCREILLLNFLDYYNKYNVQYLINFPGNAGLNLVHYYYSLLATTTTQSLFTNDPKWGSSTKIRACLSCISELAYSQDCQIKMLLILVNPIIRSTRDVLELIITRLWIIYISLTLTPLCFSWTIKWWNGLKASIINSHDDNNDEDDVINTVLVPFYPSHCSIKIKLYVTCSTRLLVI